jgi:hypothetical protein
MTVSDANFPSSKTFDLIEDALKDEASRKEMMKIGAAIFAFELTSPDGGKTVPTSPMHF